MLKNALVFITLTLVCISQCLAQDSPTEQLAEWKQNVFDNPESARRQAMARYQSARYPEDTRVPFAYAIGLAHYFEGGFHEAQTWYQQALKEPDLVQRKSPFWNQEFEAERTEAILLNNLGVVYELQGFFEMAARAYGESRQLEHQVGNVIGSWETAINEGLLLSRINDLHGARKLLHESFSFFNHEADDYHAALALLNLSITEEYDANYDEALYFVEEALIRFERISDSTHIRRCLIAKGQFHGYLSQRDALHKTIQALEKWSVESVDAQADYYQALLRAEWNLLNDRPEEALNLIESAEENLVGPPSLYEASNAIPLKVRAAYQAHHSDLFMISLGELIQTYRELFSEERARSLAEMQELNESNKYINTIEQLNTRMEHRRKQNERNVLFLMILGISGSFSVWLYHTRLKGKQALFKLMRADYKERMVRKRMSRATLPDADSAESPVVNTDFDESDKQYELFKAFVELVNDEEIYLNAKVSIGDVASRLGSNYTYLSSAINSHWGNGFIDYLNTLRIKRACDLMLEPEYFALSFDQIAERCGFQSTRTFYRQFKMVTSTTPGDFRKTAIRTSMTSR